jgi:hypothetical protein
MRYIMGLDLGQASDYTALAIVESSSDAEPRFAIRHLQRMALGTSYPKIAEYVAGLLRREPLLGNCDVVADQTGVGRAVVDLLRRYGVYPIAVTITAGDAATRDADGCRTPKRDLVAVLQVLLQQGRLKCANLPGAEILQAELLNFRVKINALTGHDSYGAGPAEEWREGAHDDLVLATALACWHAVTGPGLGLLTWMRQQVGAQVAR